MTTALTPDQQQLVAQWRFLPRRVYVALSHRADVRRLGPDDSEGAGVEGLVRAAVLFDPTRGVAFTSYAWVSVERYIVRRAAEWCRGSADLSLDGIGADGSDPFQPAAPEVEAPDCLEADRVNAALDTLPERWRTVLQLHSQGETFEAIAAALGRSNQRVCQIRDKALARLRERLGHAP